MFLFFSDCCLLFALYRSWTPHLKQVPLQFALVDLGATWLYFRSLKIMLRTSIRFWRVCGGIVVGGQDPWDYPVLTQLNWPRKAVIAPWVVLTPQSLVLLLCRVNCTLRLNGTCSSKYLLGRILHSSLRQLQLLLFMATLRQDDRLLFLKMEMTLWTHQREESERRVALPFFPDCHWESDSDSSAREEMLDNR